MEYGDTGFRLLCPCQEMDLPKGVRAKAAILKCCIPNGIPMMVMQSNNPKAR